LRLNFLRSRIRLVADHDLCFNSGLTFNQFNQSAQQTARSDDRIERVKEIIMSITNKLYKYIFRKKVQREYDALLVEKNKIEAEIAKLRENATDSLEVLDSMHQQGLISDKDYAAKKNAILAML
jgi:hypothetical protein